MTRILYGVSPIGLGHASRASAIGLKLRDRGVDVEFATGGNAFPFLTSYGFRVHDVVTEPTPSERGGVMKRPGLWYLRYWSGYRSTKPKMRALIDGLNPDLIVGDEEFSSVSLAIERKVKNALISDELELGFAKGAFSRYVEKRVSAWYGELQRKVSHLLVPDFGEDRGNLHFMGPVVRTTTMTRDQVLASLKLSSDTRFILFSASGSGIGEFLLDAVVRSFERLSLSSTVLVVTGLKGRAAGKGILYLGTERDNQNLVAAADLVISTAGKSTIDEAFSYGSPIIAIPIKNHSEQEENARAIGYSYEDVSRIYSLIPERLGRRTDPKDYRGAENISAYLRGLL
jgi:UDP-N-acetylglucosamine--N-acetylmuramyl-(pentapeptide) pyrophosphoryl-undecaprenol N-acetylglucosamine transferase